MTASLPASYFEAVYAASDDPWSFENSAYEAAKYADTLSALGQCRYQHAFEIGCSIGVLTRELAQRCDWMLAVDVNQHALDSARRRCADLPQVEFRRMQLPGEFPDGLFDLVVMSEVGYYWSRPDLERVFEQIDGALAPGGRFLLVHWTPPVADYPLRGDEVHDAALARAAESGCLSPLAGWRRASYRLDLLERAGPDGAGSVSPVAP